MKGGRKQLIETDVEEKKTDREIERGEGRAGRNLNIEGGARGGGGLGRENKRAE